MRWLLASSSWSMPSKTSACSGSHNRPFIGLKRWLLLWARWLSDSSLGLATTWSITFHLVSLQVETIQAAHVQGLIAHAVLIGVDLGPNLSITGSLATILWLLALRKEEIEVSFFDFLKVGAIAMPVALIAALGGAMLMHLVSKSS